MSTRAGSESGAGSPRTAAARESSIAIRDYTGRGFPPDLVQYRADVSRRARKRLRLYDAEGQAVPLQLSDSDRSVISFVARVEAPTTLSDHDAVITSVQGSGYVTGHGRFVLDERDSLGRGFLLR